MTAVTAVVRRDIPSGNIDNCIAINDVDGNDHIGGIAGSAKNINTSYSLPRLDGKKG